MSPYDYYFDSSGYTDMFLIGGSGSLGYLNYTGVHNTDVGVRPEISLKYK